MAKSELQIFGNSKRPESLQKNIYKIDSPYDLRNDAVTKSLNLLQNITGYDYRNNPVIDIVERLIDAKNSDLVKIGGERLLVEFGRRAGNNLLGKFIPSPTNFIDDLKNIFKKKSDASITDITKDPNRTIFDRVLQKTIGYRDNENFLDSQYGKYDNTRTSDINFNYSGDMIKEKIQQLNKKSVFSTYNTQSSKVEFETQSLVFRNTYNEDFTSSLETTNNLTETFTKSYFQPYEKEESKLIKNYDLEKKNIEKEQGFGSLNKMDGFRTDRVGLGPPKILSVENIDTYVYDSDETKQNDVNTKFGVRRGLVYFTSKLAKENPIIAHNKELIRIDNGVNPPIAYYKGNGECRTFTIYDQYDNYSNVIRFRGNNEKNSVLRDRVLPRIAPTDDDGNQDKYNYFFTMENLALKDDVEECERGPNGGRWMWFAPYDVKISDNNSVNWSDMNFLGRPEPLFSYQNTVRSLSLSFRLLIDTVKNMQDLEPTIQNYYNYLYECGQLAYKTVNEKKTVQVTGETPTQNSEIKPENLLSYTSKYYFKNDKFVLNITTPVYSTGGEFESASTENNSFISEFNVSVDSLKQLMLNKNVVEITMKFEGVATRLITQDLSTEKAKEYNRALGMRRADNLMRNVINSYNQTRGDAPEIILTSFKPELPASTTESGKIVNSVYIKEGTVVINEKKPYEQVIEGKKIIIILSTTGADSDPKPVDYDPFQKNVNDTDRIKQRYASIESIDYKVNIITENRKVDTKTEIVEQKIPADEVTQKPEPCDENKNLQFENVQAYNRFPTGFEKLNVFTPSFNSQTPFDFTKRYIFLHQLTRPSKLKDKNLTKTDNTVFGRMPVFVIRYGDFIYSKAIARSINFDITESTWDLNPEGMGAIPLYCTVTMDLTLFGGQSLAGPIDRIQTANDSNFIANSTFNTGYYAGNKTFEKARQQEKKQWPNLGSGEIPTPRKRPSNGNKPSDANLLPIPRVEQRAVQTPTKDVPPELKGTKNRLEDVPNGIDRDKPLRDAQQELNDRLMTNEYNNRG